MKLITRDTDYAVRALLCIAAHGDGKVSASRLVEELKIPRPFLRKILQSLNKARVLISHKGRGGGFTLAAKPEQIFIPYLIEIFQGDLRLNECLFKKRACPRKGTCSLRRKILGIERYVSLKLNSITIGSLLKEGYLDDKKKHHQDRRNKM